MASGTGVALQGQLHLSHDLVGVPWATGWLPACHSLFSALTCTAPGPILCGLCAQVVSLDALGWRGCPHYGAGLCPLDTLHQVPSGAVSAPLLSAACGPGNYRQAWTVPAPASPALPPPLL